MTLCQTLCLDYDNEMKATRRLLERIPLEKHADWQPHAKSMPLARLATHVAELPEWLDMALTTEVFDMPADFKPSVAATKEELLATFDRCAAKGRAAIDATPDAALEKTWSFRWNGQVAFSDTRPQVIRSFQNHLVHHRAQLTVYLRLLDIKVPGLYGPSADDEWPPAA